MTSTAGATPITVDRVAGTMPIMLKSRHCNLIGLTPRELVRHHEEPEVRTTATNACIHDWLQEFGGYFVVNGNDKVIRMLVAQRRNHVCRVTHPLALTLAGRRVLARVAQEPRRPVLVLRLQHALRQRRLLHPGAL